MPCALTRFFIRPTGGVANQFSIHFSFSPFGSVYYLCFAGSISNGVQLLLLFRCVGCARCGEMPLWGVSGTISLMQIASMLVYAWCGVVSAR
ncbi:hypothetical protein EI94DRAFT_231372 [Lactarius quietus]|nr:hypothetical protein EI94DRAFT_231372 [Lactarius quietus]